MNNNQAEAKQSGGSYNLEAERRIWMKKWIFWITMCITSILNGVFFFGASASAMSRGLDEVDNQAALLFIPILWMIAVIVLLAINIYTLVQGSNIKRNQTINFLDIFHLFGLSKKVKVFKIVFLLITCLFMIFGYSLFAEEMIWAVSYALSGGVLLLFLYSWTKTSVRNSRVAKI